MKIFSGRSNPELTADIARYLDTEVGKVDIEEFSDGEINVKYLENIRGQDVVLVQSLYPNTHTALTELCLMAYGARTAGKAKRVIAVLPYFSYSRQDKADGRSPISAAWVTRILKASYVDQVIILDIHSDQTSGFFQDVLVDSLFATPLHVQDIRAQNFKKSKTVIVAPDFGSVKRSRRYSEMLGFGLALIDKRRPEPNVAEVGFLMGESVKGKDCLVVDDMLDTGGTIVKATDLLLENGAKRVWVWVTHGILSGKAEERIQSSKLHRLTITDTVKPPFDVSKSDKIKVLTTSKLLGETVDRVVHNGSLKNMFDERF